MVKLLIYDTAPEPLEAEHSFGGLPVASDAANFAWPLCKSCKGPMQYLGRLRIPDEPKFVLLFMCQNALGLCDEWDAYAGGNSAILMQTNGLTEVQAPGEGVTLRGAIYGAREMKSELTDYDPAREAWSKETGRNPREVLGQIAGEPAWIQADETPMCEACGKPMRFLAQLEQGPDWKTEMNFGGGGCAYVFDCSCGEHFAKFLWQC